MYSLTVYDGMHIGGTKFYRIVVATGPHSSVAIFQWGPAPAPKTTAAATSRRSSMFRRGQGAVTEARQKLNEKSRTHAGGKYTFTSSGALGHATFGDLMQAPEFEVLCDEDKARVLTSLAEPNVAEMEGMETYTLEEIRLRLVAFHGMDGLVPRPTPSVTSSQPAPAERYGADDRWGAW